jgi:hypothetical protein
MQLAVCASMGRPGRQQVRDKVKVKGTPNFLVMFTHITLQLLEVGLVSDSKACGDTVQRLP